jgi:hypothetical protein
MLISEVTGSENSGAGNELIIAVQDLLSRYIADDEGPEDIPTETFKAELEANTGLVLNTGTLVKAINDSGYASSVDADTIRANGDLPSDIDTDPEDTVDVGQMAGNQAMKDIKADL